MESFEIKLFKIISQNPKFYLIDEAFSSIDPNHEIILTPLEV